MHPTCGKPQWHLLADASKHYCFHPLLLAKCIIEALSKVWKTVLMDFFFFIDLFYFWLCWGFVAACGLSLVAASGVYFLLQCAGFSLQWLLLLGVTGSGRMASVVVVRRLSSCGAWALECRLSSCGAWA